MFFMVIPKEQTFIFITLIPLTVLYTINAILLGFFVWWFMLAVYCTDKGNL